MFNNENKSGVYEEKDPRDYLAKEILGAPEPIYLTNYIDLRKTFSKPKNQGATVWCVPFAGIETFEIMNEREFDKDVNFEPKPLWDQMEKLGLTSERGAELKSCLKVLKDNGSTNTLTGKLHKITGFAKIENTFEDWFYWLSCGFPLYTAANMDNVATRKNNGEFVFGLPTQGHAFLICGADKLSRKATGLNSYGEKWGYFGDGSFLIDATQIPSFMSTYVLYDEKDLDFLFKDVTQNHWGYDAIKYYTDKGILNGYEDGTFRPNNPITRAELVSLLKKLNIG